LRRSSNSAAILGTFDHEVRGGEVNIVHKSETHNIQGVPCSLVDMRVSSEAQFPSPVVELLFELDFQRGIDAVRRRSMRKLIAMDWSGLAQYGSATGELPDHVVVWRDNVLGFLANQTDMARAERFRTTIASRHATKRPRRLANDVRKDIDRHLITANHWGETREDIRTERHQALLSDLLGALHLAASPASPIYLSRELARTYRLSLDQKAAMTLQYGTGHCGEHSRTSFSILGTIMSTPGNHLDSIVLCGNANIDHAFVLCNLQVSRVVRTTATSAENTRTTIGGELTVFNLRDALEQNAGRDVFVVDPYLDRSMMSATAAGLLRSLNSKKKKRRGKDTDFLLYQIQDPVPADFTIEDIRDRSLVERETRVRNV
jgi:hypothetical protein